MTDLVYMVAINGGGTKTEFALLNNDGTLNRRVVFGGSNPNIVGLECACNTLKNGIESFNIPKEQITGIFAGISGCGASKNKDFVTSFLKDKFPNSAVKCHTDIFNVLGCEPDSKEVVLL